MGGAFPPPGMAGRFEQTSGERGGNPGEPNQRLIPGKKRPGLKKRPSLIARLIAQLRRR
jgi:hypothetical protein